MSDEPIAKDAEGWPIRVGTRVRVQPRALAGNSIAPSPYKGRVVGSESCPGQPFVLIVRDEKRQAVRSAYPASCVVIRGSDSFNDRLLVARLRGEERREAEKVAAKRGRNVRRKGL